MIDRGEPFVAEVVGVVRDVRDFGLGFPHVPVMYVSARQDPPMTMRFTLRADHDPAAVAAGLRAALKAVDPTLPVGELLTLEDVVRESLGEPRLRSTLIGAFAALAFGLAMLGLYGALSCSVSCRTREIGLRMALGADRREVVRLVFSEGSALLGLGLALGILASVPLAALMRSQLVGVSPADPLVYAAVVVVFALTGCAACALPARRAIAIEPSTALREGLGEPPWI